MSAKVCESIDELGLEGVRGLLAEGASVHDEEDAAEALGLHQPVDEPDDRCASCRCRWPWRRGRSGGPPPGRPRRRGWRSSGSRAAAARAGPPAPRAGASRRRPRPASSSSSRPSGEYQPVERARGIARAAHVVEPDAALGLELLEVGAPVGREEEGQAAGAPGAAGERDVALGGEGLGVAVGLGEGAGHIRAPALGLHHGHGLEAHEEDIVGATVGGGPLGDGLGAAGLGAGAVLVGEALRVRLPTGLAELRVDETAGVGFVQLQLLAGLVGGSGQLLQGLGWLGGGTGLEGGQLLGELFLGLLGELLPDVAVLGIAPGPLLRVEPAAGLGLGGGTGGLGVELRGAEALAQALQLGTRVRCSPGSGPAGGMKGPGLKSGGPGRRSAGTRWRAAGPCFSRGVPPHDWR